MKERPILFSGEMVRAVLDGRKTQTRRVMKTQPEHRWNFLWMNDDAAYFCSGEHEKGDKCVGDESIKCPYGKSGDRLWVKETHTDIPDWDISSGTPEPIIGWMYKADFDYVYSPPGGWTPSIFMPRRASRILLEITNIRVERLQDISEEDAKAEGVYHSNGKPDETGMPTELVVYARGEFAHLWEKINVKFTWGLNPWLWVIEFKRINL